MKARGLTVLGLLSKGGIELAILSEALEIEATSIDLYSCIILLIAAVAFTYFIYALLL